MDNFGVTVAICAHREIQAEVFMRMNLLGHCPNPKVTIQVQDGDALVSRSRSVVATHFLNKTQDEMLMFIDDDVVINPKDAMKLMHIAHEKKLPILGGAYVTKSQKSPGLAIRPLKSGPIGFGSEGGLYPMRSISTGCMIIRREVLEKFIKKDLAPLCKHGQGGTHDYYPFFQHTKMKIGGVWEDISEDWYFCEKARELGFSVWCDTTIKLGHIGNFEYSWDQIIQKKLGENKTYAGYTFNAVVEHTGLTPEAEPIGA